MFSSKRLIVSGFTFKSLIHFELIFVYSVRNWFSFILSHVVVQVFPPIFTEETVLSPLYVLCSYVVN